MSMSGVGLGIDAEAVLENNTALRRHARLELLFAVIVLETSRTRAAFFTKNKQLLLVCLKTEQDV